MNFLAHAVLSFDNEGLLVGNIISDFVKGKSQYNFSDNIRKGIVLHREIDNYTDQHPVNKEAKKIFQKEYGLYSGIFIDISYDYFVANDNNLFPGNILKTFTQETYQTLEANLESLPQKFRSIFPFMKLENWLYNYRYDWGIANSFRGIIHRSKFINDELPAIKLFNENRQLLHQYYNEFFPELKNFTLNEINSMDKPS